MQPLLIAMRADIETNNGAVGAVFEDKVVAAGRDGRNRK